VNIYDGVEYARGSLTSRVGQLEFEDEQCTPRKWKEDILLQVSSLFDKGARNVTFSCYRRGDISSTHTASQRVAPNEVQFDGVVFHDGTTVIRWNTLAHSTAVFPSLYDLLEIHGHPEYGSEIVLEGEK
jgi:hypothetical protein